MTTGPTGGADTHAYVVSASLRQRLDLIHHLIGFGRQIIVVAGAPGSGRSRLLEAVASEAGAEWLVLEIDGARLDSCAELLNVLLDALEPVAAERPQSVEDMEARVCRQLAQHHSEHRIAVLVADDCDGFDDAINALMFRLAHTDSGVGELRIVLSCDPDSGYAEHLQTQSPQTTLLHLVEVPPLSENEVRDIAVQFGQPPDTLDAYSVAALTVRCAGNPARLLDLLETAASEPATAAPTAEPAASEFNTQTTDAAPAGAEDSTHGTQDLLKRAAGIAVVVFAALGLAALTLFDNRKDAPPAVGIEVELPSAAVPESPVPDPAPKPPEDDAAALAEMVPAPATAMAPPQPVAPPEMPGTAPNQQAQPVAEEPQPAASAQVAASTAPPGTTGASSAPQAAGTRQALPAAKEKIGDPADTTTTTAAPPAPERHGPVAAPTPAPAPIAAALPTAPASPATAPPYTAQWVLTNSDKSYVIQLFGVRDRGSAERFIKANNLGRRAAVFDLIHESAPWYVVALGHFPDRAAARAAIARLPAQLKATGPWPRAVASLRK